MSRGRRWLCLYFSVAHASNGREDLRCWSDAANLSSEICCLTSPVLQPDCWRNPHYTPARCCCTANNGAASPGDQTFQNHDPGDNSTAYQCWIGESISYERCCVPLHEGRHVSEDCFTGSRSPELCCGLQFIAQADDGDLLKAHRCCYGDFTFAPPSPRAGPLDVLVVIAATKGQDLTWLRDQPYHAHVLSDVTAAGERLHWGRDSANYIRFILDYYDALPQRLVFLHSHRSAWEIGDQAEILRHIDPFSYDFAGLSEPFQIAMYGHDYIHATPFMHDVVQDSALVARWPREDGRFASATGKLEHAFSYHLGAAFLVSARRVQLRSRTTWQRILDYVSQPYSDPRDPIRPLKNLEQTWHMLFGEDPLLAPPVPERLCPEAPIGVCKHRPFYRTDIQRAQLEWYSAVLQQSRALPLGQPPNQWCWHPAHGFTYDHCCATLPDGNNACWDRFFSATRCCGTEWLHLRDQAVAAAHKHDVEMPLT